MSQPSVEDPTYLQAVGDLLGVLAYGELIAGLQLGDPGLKAPTVASARKIAGIAAHKFAHHRQLCGRLEELGLDPDAAMRPFVEPFTDYHERTSPNDWMEALVKSYVGEGIARDFYRETTAVVDERTREVMLEALVDDDEPAHIDLLRTAMEVDHTLGGRLALWSRRLLGEALSQGQLVAASRDELAGLLVGGAGGLAGVGEMFTRLQSAHRIRLARLGLDA